VPGYDRTKAQNIKQARTNLQTISRNSQLWTDYLKGNYEPALTSEGAISVLSYAVIGAILVVTVAGVVLFGVLLTFRIRGPRYGRYGAPKFCMSCGRPLSGFEQFCDRCGSPQF